LFEMREIKLTDEEIQAVAEYLQTIVQ